MGELEWLLGLRRCHRMQSGYFFERLHNQNENVEIEYSTSIHSASLAETSITGGVGCDLAMRRRVASWRPATGYMEAGDKFFAWLVAVPEGAVTGTLSADGVTRQVTGSETPIRALIEWRHNDKAAHPGARGVLEWSPAR